MKALKLISPLLVVLRRVAAHIGFTFVRAEVASFYGPETTPASIAENQKLMDLVEQHQNKHSKAGRDSGGR